MKTKKAAIKWQRDGETEIKDGTVLFVSSDKELRISMFPDYFFDLDKECREMFSRERVGTKISSRALEKKEQKYRNYIKEKGVWVLTLEKWNPTAGVGYEKVYSIEKIDAAPEDRFFVNMVEEMKHEAKEMKKAV